MATGDFPNVPFSPGRATSGYIEVHTRLGWECPRCHRCHSPDVQMCLGCAPSSNSEFTSQNIEFCVQPVKSGPERIKFTMPTLEAGMFDPSKMTWDKAE